MASTPFYQVDPSHSGEHGREIRVFGPPGTGKTSFLTGSVKNTALLRGPHNVLVASFTVAAATELASRGLPLPKSQLGTLHSLAYRCLDRPPVADEIIDDWNRDHPAYALSASGRRVNVDDGQPADPGVGGATEGDAMASAYDILRARMVPRDDWPRDVTQYATTWEDWKRGEGVIDFTDMIEQALEQVEVFPGRPDVGFFDEVQDFTPLELALIRQWGQHMERVVMAGDDDQTLYCHPAGVRVRTTNRGDVPIEELDEATDRLVSFDKKGGSEIRRRGYEFKLGVSPHVGRMLTVVTGDQRVPVTVGHRLAARWAPRDGHVVYLMRRGDRWRIGVTGLHKTANGIFGLGMRARQEKAEEAWILSLHDDRSAALVAEELASLRYGISRAVFEWQPRLGVSQDDLDRLHDEAAKYSDVAGCLAAHGREIAHPIWVKDYAGRGRKSIMDLRACNLEPGWMLLPHDDGTPRAVWRGCEVEESWHEGLVYSLNVQPYEHYIAEGVVVHNSFKGASPDAFLNPAIPDCDKIVLSQSWRIPSSVHAAAEHWIRQVARREDKLYSPREEVGVVRHIPANFQQPQLMADTIETALATTVPDEEVDGGRRSATVMVLASCGYMLDPVKHELRARGLPFHNPYRRTRGDWNPLGGPAGGKNVSSKERLLSYLLLDERPDMGLGDLSRPWTGEDVRRWAHVVKKQGIFARGAAGALEQLPTGELDFETHLAPLFASEVELEQAVTPDLGWFESNLLAASRAGMAFPIAVAKQRGPRALLEVPRVVLGTIHSVKGGQADVVVLVPDLSARGSNEWEKKGETADAVRRQMYVGMTRARHELAVCNPATQKFVAPEQLIYGAKRKTA